MQRTLKIKIRKPVFEPAIPGDILAMLNAVKPIKKIENSDSMDTQKILDIMNKQRTESKIEEIEKYNIESQSAKCSINHPFKIDIFAQIIKGIIANKPGTSKIIGLFYGLEKYGKFKAKKPKPKAKESNRENKLYNQVAINYDLGVDGRYLHIHFFHNGSISMVGCINRDDGIRAMEDIVETVLKPNPILFGNESHVEDIKMYNYSITMINSVFHLQFKINRDELYDIVLNEYNMFVNLTKEKYAGVKISYMYNEYGDGICHCEKKCSLEKLRRKHNKCKIISVIVFSKGSVIITGANDEAQINIAYKFITDLIRKNYSRLMILNIEDILTASLT